MNKMVSQYREDFTSVNSIVQCAMAIVYACLECLQRVTSICSKVKMNNKDLGAVYFVPRSLDGIKDGIILLHRNRSSG